MRFYILVYSSGDLCIVDSSCTSCQKPLTGPGLIAKIFTRRHNRKGNPRHPKWTSHYLPSSQLFRAEQRRVCNALTVSHLYMFRSFNYHFQCRDIDNAGGPVYLCPMGRLVIPLQVLPHAVAGTSFMRYLFKLIMHSSNITGNRMGSAWFTTHRT